MVKFLKKYWFIAGLISVFCLIMLDAGGVLTAMGKWFKAHHGTDIIMFVIFLGSGLMLDVRNVAGGSGNLKGLLAALALIFVCAPLVAALFGKIPLGHGAVIGLFIVSAAPTTLSSGVVMTTVSGGNMAHALSVSLLSNALSVLTVPLTLPLLLSGISENASITIDQQGMVFKLGLLVLCPLLLGLFSRNFLNLSINRSAGSIQILNQLLILLMVCVGLSQARETLFAEGIQIIWIVFMVAIFHVLLLMVAMAMTRLLGLPSPVRKSVIFMGCQKTLPLTLMVQVSAFSMFPLALVVCVLHHSTQLFIDGYLVGRFGRRHR